MIKRKLDKYYGEVPLHIKGPNKGRIDRKKLSIHFGFTVDEIFKAYWNWQEIFRYEDSDLTFHAYLNKLKHAGLTPKDVGNDPGKYNLSRYNDEGSYTDKNCRFITREENLAEQKH